MNSNDHDLIASSLRLSKPERFYGGAEQIQWYSDCFHLAVNLLKENEEFKPYKFFVLCGFEETDINIAMSKFDGMPS